MIKLENTEVAGKGRDSLSFMTISDLKRAIKDLPDDICIVIPIMDESNADNIVDILRDPSVKDVIVGFVNMNNEDAGDAAVATTMTTDRSVNKFITYKIISQIFGENYDSAMMLLQDFEELRKWKKDNNIEHLIIQREL